MTTGYIAQMKPIQNLYYKYYQSNAQSSVTSSHWKNHGETPSLLANGEIDISGMGGFRDFVPASAKNYLRHLLYHFLISNYLKRFSRNQNISIASRIVAKKSKRLFLYDCAKNSIIVETALRGLQCETFGSKNLRKIAIIGDGYGYLGNLLKLLEPNLQIVFINLGKQLLFDMQTTSQIHQNAKSQLIENSDQFMGSEDFQFLEAENFKLLAGANIDFFFNVASMQEMDKEIVDEYFNLMRQSQSKPTYFYCCNRIEKILPNGSPIRFLDYPWKNSKVLWEEKNPGWYSRYPSARPPFWKPFDGEFMARLVKF